MKHSHPYGYKSHFCGCGKEIRYLSKKQLNFLIRIHESSRKHRDTFGWTPTITSNEEFGKSLQELLT